MQKTKRFASQQDIPAKITQRNGSVLVEFDETIPKDAVKEQIESCEEGTCTCCTPEFREEVDRFNVIEKGKSVDVEIIGSISADHVKENLISCAPKLKKEK